jgi:copper(I)-binding protein
MKTLQRLTTLVLVAGAMGAASAHDFHVGAIGVDRACVGPSAVGQREDPAFLMITNIGKDDVLVGVTCSAASSVELRAAIPTEGGIGTRTLSAIPIPANSMLELKRQGYHLAFISLSHSFAAGDRIAATLRFASGAELVVEFQVDEAISADSRADEK